MTFVGVTRLASHWGPDPQAGSSITGTHLCGQVSCYSSFAFSGVRSCETGHVTFSRSLRSEYCWGFKRILVDVSCGILETGGTREYGTVQFVNLHRYCIKQKGYFAEVWLRKRYVSRIMYENIAILSREKCTK